MKPPLHLSKIWNKDSEICLEVSQLTEKSIRCTRLHKFHL